MRILTGALTLCLSACSGSEENGTRFSEEVPKIGAYDLLVEQSQDGLKELKFCGKKGSCGSPEPYPCKVVKRLPKSQEILAKVTEAMSQSHPKQYTLRYLATFAGLERAYGDRCEVELSGLSAVRVYSYPTITR